MGFRRRVVLGLMLAAGADRAARRLDRTSEDVSAFLTTSPVLFVPIAPHVVWSMPPAA